MSTIGTIARRTFLFGAVAIAGGAAFGVYHLRKTPPNPLTPGAGETALSAFVLIDEVGVTLVAPRAEMGQGTHTTWAALIAEELDVAWEDIRVIHGPPGQAYYNSAMMAEGLPNKGYDASEFAHNLGELMGGIGKLMSLQVTGGSTAMKDGYERMRVAGATARELLKAAAAQRLGISVTSLRTENGQVIAPDGASFSYSELAADAAAQEPPRIELRDPTQWRLLGKSLPRVDMVGKSTGTAEYAIDVRLPGMKYAAVRMSPRRGTMRSFDDRPVEDMAGVEKVVDLGDGVAVVASNTWLAQQAVDAIEVVWGPAPYPSGMGEIESRITAGFETEPNSTMRDDGDVTNVPADATLVEAEYTVPFLAHATMEPMNAVAWLRGGGLEVWSGNQGPTFIRDACADAAGIGADRVVVHTTLMGGGFGRRGELDFSVIATKLAMAMPGTPIKATWSREEDMTHDFYRPMAKARMRGAVRDKTAVMLDAQVSAPSVARQALARWTGFAPGGADKVTVEGLFNQPYGIENYRVRGYLADLDVPIGFWRSVGNSHNGFFHESFMDELAHAAGEDPMRFRMELARNEWDPAYRVLKTVRDMSGWTGTTPENVGRGVAMCYSFGTPVAVVIEVRDEDGQVRIAKAWMACDMGLALDPSIVEAQMSGGLIYGLSAAVSEEITFDDGMVQQLNFPDYDALRIFNTPEIEVKVLSNQRRMGGAGEPGTPPAAPALANALFDLTGQRLREMPFNRSIDFLV